jgi:hypothetical protein
MWRITEKIINFRREIKEKINMEKFENLIIFPSKRPVIDIIPQGLSIKN